METALSLIAGAAANAEIVSVQTHAERALQELAAVREREQALLQCRVEVFERQFREGIADLEHRFLLQVTFAASYTPPSLVH